MNTSFALKNIGIDGCELQPEVRAFFYRTYCRPILWYGTECLNLSSSEIQKFKTHDASTVKRLLHLGKHSKTCVLLNALRLESAEMKFDIAKLKFLIRLKDNPLTCQIMEQELRNVQQHPSKVGCGKWATHLEEVLDVLRRNSEDWYRGIFDSLNCSLLFDPDDTVSNCPPGLQQLSLGALEIEAGNVIRAMSKAVKKDFQGGLSDTIRHLLWKNNNESRKVLKQYLWHCKALEVKKPAMVMVRKRNKKRKRVTRSTASKRQRIT